MSFIDNYKLKKTLGSGAFSKVKLAETLEGEQVALKISKRFDSDENTEDGSLFYSEVNALRRLKHPNIIKLHNFSDDSTVKRKDGSMLEVAYIAIDYCKHGELFDYIAQTDKFSEEEARYYFHQLISALEYMHNKGYSHRDVKPENLLLDENFNLVLADFGFCTRELTSKSRKGTFGYMAPEVLAHQKYLCRAHDLYGAAVVLFILVTQHPPFIRAEPRDKYFKKIHDERWEQFWKIHSDQSLSSSFIDMMTRMLAEDPADRLSLSQIKEHEWFNGPVPTKEEILSIFTKKSCNMKRTKHIAKSSNVKPAPSHRMLTRFYEVENGDDLLDLACNFAKVNGYPIDKSKEFFRAEMIAEELGEQTRILISVLKRPQGTERCLEFKMVEGNGFTFSNTFNDFKKFIS